MTTIDDLLARHPVVLMDGGMGSSVEDRGVSVRNHLWGSHALLTPEGLAVNDRLHVEFREAGARILIANTHNALLTSCAAWLEDAPASSPPAELEGVAAADRAGALHRLVHERAVASARRAIPPGEEVLVAAGMGSPEGPYATESAHSPEEIEDLLAPQVAAYRELGVELALFETLTTAQEIAGVALLARREGLEAFGVGLTCGEDGRTCAGVSMREAVDLLGEAAPAVFFVQCTPLHLVERALGELVSALGDGAVTGVYANDGRVWVDMRWRGERTSPATYADHAVRWRDMGARVIGGCCGTDPDHVRELAARLEI